jgi:LysM repeat protein
MLVESSPMRKQLLFALFSLFCLAWLSFRPTPLASAQEPTSTEVATTVAPRGPTPLPVFVVATVTAYPDGSITHIVQSGQTLYTIAEAYSVTVQSILDLNNRRLDAQLFVGDKLLIRAAFTPTPTSDATNTPSPRPPTATRRPTRTATPVPPTATPSPTVTASPTATPVPELGVDPVGNVLLSVVVILLVLGVIFVIAGAILKLQAPSGSPPG